MTRKRWKIGEEWNRYQREWRQRNLERVRKQDYERLKLWRQRNPERSRAITRRARINLKRKTIDALGGKCKMCGNEDPIVLEVHHNVPLNTKNRQPHTEWRKALKEPESCTLLCANCHIKVHYDMDNSHRGIN